MWAGIRFFRISGFFTSLWINLEIDADPVKKLGGGLGVLSLGTVSGYRDHCTCAQYAVCTHKYTTNYLQQHSNVVTQYRATRDAVTVVSRLRDENIPPFPLFWSPILVPFEIDADSMRSQNK